MSIGPAGVPHVKVAGSQERCGMNCSPLSNSKDPSNQPSVQLAGAIVTMMGVFTGLIVKMSFHRCHSTLSLADLRMYVWSPGTSIKLMTGCRFHCYNIVFSVMMKAFKQGKVHKACVARSDGERS